MSAAEYCRQGCLACSCKLSTPGCTQLGHMISSTGSMAPIVHHNPNPNLHPNLEDITIL